MYMSVLMLLIMFDFYYFIVSVISYIAFKRSTPYVSIMVFITLLLWFMSGVYMFLFYIFIFFAFMVMFLFF